MRAKAYRRELQSRVMERVGIVSALWRYPVKSMLGERVDSSAVTDRGLAGDRGYALRDAETGKIVSAKRPRYWARMFELRARYAAPPEAGSPLPTALVALPDGAELSTDDPGFESALSDFLGRKVGLVSTTEDLSVLEEVWIPEKQSDPYGPVVGTEGDDRMIEIPASIAAPPGTFFDYSAVHVVTTGTLSALTDAYPDGTMNARRFRPNIVIEVPDTGFVENDWLERTLRVGDAVRLEVLTLTPRCVMTTLAQDDLPRDPTILRTVARENRLPWGPFGEQPCVGLYTEVVSGGTVMDGNEVVLE
jgi:uncharacterized protein YcbX